jgi:hypothetical protein
MFFITKEVDHDHPLVLKFTYFSKKNKIFIANLFCCKYKTTLVMKPSEYERNSLTYKKSKFKYVICISVTFAFNFYGITKKKNQVICDYFFMFR